MLKKLGTTFAIVLLALAGACGGDSDTSDTAATDDTAEDGSDSESLTKAEFIEQGDTICLALSMASEEVEPPDSPEGMPLYLTELVGQAEEALRQFELLEPPADGQDVHESLILALGTSIATVEGAITAYENGDQVTGGDLLTQAAEEGDAADEELQAYGFEQCGKLAPAEEGDAPAEGDGSSEPAE